MNSQQDQRSYLFLVRFWRDGAQEVENEKEWSGRVQHVLSGEARTFHDWPILIDLLLEMAQIDGTDATLPDGRTKEAVQ